MLSCNYKYISDTPFVLDLRHHVYDPSKQFFMYALRNYKIYGTELPLKVCRVGMFNDAVLIPRPGFK